MDLDGARWRTSSFSGDDGNNGCVEVAFLPDGRVGVRDTKDRTRAPHVHLSTQWSVFVAAVRSETFEPV